MIEVHETQYFSKTGVMGNRVRMNDAALRIRDQVLKVLKCQTRNYTRRLQRLVVGPGGHRGILCITASFD